MSNYGTIDISDYEPIDNDAGSGEGIEDGIYRMHITDVEKTTTRSGGAVILEHSFLEDFNFDPWPIKTWLNLWSENPKAKEMAYRTMASIALALELPKIIEIDKLLGIAMYCRVEKIGKYRTVTGYYPYGDEKPAYKVSWQKEKDSKEKSDYIGAPKSTSKGQVTNWDDHPKNRSATAAATSSIEIEDEPPF